MVLLPSWLMGWAMGIIGGTQMLMAEIVLFFYTLLPVLRIFSSPDCRLGGTISAYKIVPDEIEEIKVQYGIFHLYRDLVSWHQ